MKIIHYGRNEFRLEMVFRPILENQVVEMWIEDKMADFCFHILIS